MENKSLYTREQLVDLLASRGEKQAELLKKSQRVKLENVGDKVYLRGLVELSNKCSKNCYYCGIRVGNLHCIRYTVSDQEVLEAAIFAYQNGFGSVVLQAGECSDTDYIRRIQNLLSKMMQVSNGNLGITLSLGEQTKETYLRWKEAGALRYLLRMETSNPNLYAKLHPQNHSFEERLNCLYSLKEIGYQVGTGVMIGLPFQTLEDLADDLLFFQTLDVDMVGMGPYVEHKETPLYQYKDLLYEKFERYEYTMNMLALLRIMMPQINIAATTALGSIKEMGREQAIRIAANVIMPNLTPFVYRENYFLYDNKICINESHLDSLNNIQALVNRAGAVLALGEQGNSLHFKNKKDIKN